MKITQNAEKNNDHLNLKIKLLYTQAYVFIKDNSNNSLFMKHVYGFYGRYGSSLSTNIEMEVSELNLNVAK